MTAKLYKITLSTPALFDMTMRHEVCLEKPRLYASVVHYKDAKCILVTGGSYDDLDSDEGEWLDSREIWRFSLRKKTWSKESALM